MFEVRHPGNPAGVINFQPTLKSPATRNPDRNGGTRPAGPSSLYGSWPHTNAEELRDQLRRVARAGTHVPKLVVCHVRRIGKFKPVAIDTNNFRKNNEQCFDNSFNRTSGNIGVKIFPLKSEWNFHSSEWNFHSGEWKFHSYEWNFHSVEWKYFREKFFRK